MHIIISAILWLCVIVSTATAQDSPVIPFVDAHVHLSRPAALVQLMNSEQIDKAIVFWGRDSDNVTLAEAARAHPDRLIPFVSVSPERRRYRDFWSGDEKPLLGEVKDLLETGMYKGIGEISVVHFPSRGFPEADFDPLGAMMTGLMHLAQQFRVPITIHCEITRLREFASLLNAFPDVQVIWAHGGYTPYFLARRMIERHDNLTYELSARTYLRHRRSPDYTIFRNETKVWPRWLELIEDYPTRFIVGSDGTQRRPESDRSKIDRVRLLLSQLTAETRELVATGNIRHLVGQ